MTLMRLPLLLLAISVLPLQADKAPTIEQGRYQLVLASPQQLFLLDSQTGRVWHYRPESSLPNAGGRPPEIVLEAFMPVMIQSGGKMQVTPDALQGN